jgi:hypothetical protein
VSTRRLVGRRGWRRIVIGVAGAAVLVVGLKCGTMYWFAESGASAFRDGRYDDSVTSFGRLETFIVVDPALAFVGIGDAEYRRGDLVAAELAFARALDLDPGDCEIRFNLAVTVEAQGDRLLAGEPLSPSEPDEAFDPSAPRRDVPLERYNIALVIANGEPCPSAEVDDVGDRLAATRDRIEAKLDAIRDETGDSDSEQPESPRNDRGDSEEIENLELRNQGGANQREQARDRDTTGVLPDGQSNW